MADPIISYYPHIKEVKKGFDMKLSTFLDRVKDGHWQDEVLAYRNAKTKENKAKLPYVTISGQFKERNNAGIEKHSGYIAMDIDGLTDLNAVREELCCDPYFYAVFVSCGGSGLCAISKINPKSHLESFNFLSEYLYTKYNITEVDEHCKDVSRPRFVSFDPDLYINTNCQLLHIKPEVKKKPVNTNYVFVQSDFTAIIEAITDRKIDITTNYKDWINTGFALATKFGERGRDYFHAISQYNPEYNHEKADRKFSHLLRTGSKDMSIGIIYNLCKSNNIEVYSRDTKTAIQAAKHAKKGSRTEASVKETLEKFSDISPEKLTELEPIISKAFNENVVHESSGIISDIKNFLSLNYEMRRNEITRNIEIDNIPIDDISLNSIYIECKTAVEDASKDLVTSIIFSNFTTSYNPFIEFINTYQGQPKGNIAKLCATIETDTPNHELWITKWLVSMIATVHGTHSPLMLVLCGSKQNTGKTQWFRRFLPDRLKKYYAEDKLDQGKDSEILMTKKLIIMDDEMGGKSKKEEKRLKEMTSKETFSVREPYGRVSLDLIRLALLGGTSNEEDLLTDITGNRRILPVRVLSIDHAAYNKINKYHLFIECYNLYKSGYNYELTNEDIALLKESTIEFKAVSVEEDMILKYWKKPITDNCEYITSTEMMSEIKIRAQISVSHIKIGIVLRNLGFEKTMKKIDGNPAYRWKVVTLSSLPHENLTTPEIPFS